MRTRDLESKSGEAWRSVWVPARARLSMGSELEVWLRGAPSTAVLQLCGLDGRAVIKHMRPRGNRAMRVGRLR